MDRVDDRFGDGFSARRSPLLFGEGSLVWRWSRVGSRRATAGGSRPAAAQYVATSTRGSSVHARSTVAAPAAATSSSSATNAAAVSSLAAPSRFTAQITARSASFCASVSRTSSQHKPSAA